MKKKILLITTGGTIASAQSDGGLIPSTDGGGLLYYMGSMASLYTITICDLLTLDSSNIQPEEWQLIAEEVFAQKQNFDAIVITHGTDTMAYTASMLSFMLRGIAIPVVITGSQLPIHHPLTDAVTNLRCAFEMANSGVAGVYVAFDRKIMLGCRTVKVKTSGFAAFESVNLPPVAIIDSDGLRLNRKILPQTTEECLLKHNIDNRVFLLKLIPGTDPNILPAIAGLGCSAIVIEAFGSGGMNYLRRDFVGMLDVLVERDIAVVVCSQCLYDRSDLSVYEVGRRALAKGVIPGGDMTSEAAVTKLMWGLGQIDQSKGERIKQLANLFSQSLVGEITLER